VALSALTTRQADAFEKGVPTAHVVRIPGAHHYVYLSNEADVLREMKSAVNRNCPHYQISCLTLKSNIGFTDVSETRIFDNLRGISPKSQNPTFSRRPRDTW
jgi:hypothetical protein